MPRIILKSPFLRHFAGSVFDLEVSTWRMDERVYDRISPQKNYLLPDGGKGFPAELPVYETMICPPAVFATIDLRTGPCRLTSVQTQPALQTGIGLDTEQVQLSADKQTITLKLPPGSPAPRLLKIGNRTHNSLIQEYQVEASAFDLSFSDYMPGFYELRLSCEQNVEHLITFIKCFPLVVSVNPRTGVSTITKTVY